MDWTTILKESMKEAGVPEDVRKKIDKMVKDIIEYREFVTQQSKASHFNEFDQSSFSEMSRTFDKLLDLSEEINHLGE